MGFELCSVDTNVILRLISRDNIEMYERAVDLITTNGMYFYVPDFVIGEIVHVLEKNCQRDTIVTAIQTVMQAPRLDYYEELFSKVFAMYLAHPKLSFNDCYLVYKAEEKGRVPLFTFDAKLAKQHKAAKLVPAASS